MCYTVQNDSVILNSATHRALGNMDNNSQLYTKIYCGSIKAEKWKIINSLSMTLMFITAKTKCPHNITF